MKKPSSSILSLVKKSFFFQDISSSIVNSINPVVEHNFSKFFAIKKAFYITAMENLDGDYYEFGVFTGSSFACALKSHRKMKAIAPNIKTSFFGFDSFKGFGKVTKEDKHWWFKDYLFAVPHEKKIINFIRKKAKGSKFKIIKGFYDKTLKNKTCKLLSKNKIRIVFIDCDMKEPAKLAFDFVKPGLQEGTIIIMDDFFFYRGRKDKGIAGAFFEFGNKNKNIEFRKLYDYGYGSVAYIVSRIK